MFTLPNFFFIHLITIQLIITLSFCGGIYCGIQCRYQLSELFYQRHTNSYQWAVSTWQFGSRVHGYSWARGSAKVLLNSSISLLPWLHLVYVRLIWLDEVDGLIKYIWHIVSEIRRLKYTCGTLHPHHFYRSAWTQNLVKIQWGD